MIDYVIGYGGFCLVFVVLWVEYWRAGVRLRRDRELERAGQEAAAEQR